MSKLTKTTANFAVASVQRHSIALIYFNGMSQLTLEPGINLMAQGSQERQASSSEASQESGTLDQEEAMTGTENQDQSANDATIESQCADVGDICPLPSIFEDVDFSWFDSGLLDLTVGAPGDMTSFDAAVAAHDKTGENEDSTLTNNDSLGPSFSGRSEAYQRCAWTSWHPSRFQHSFHGQDVINLGAGTAGAIIVPERRIQVTGLVMHEILRRAMTQLYESDNSTTRDLQAFFMQPGYTMLFQAGAFSSPPDQLFAGCPEICFEELDAMWEAWSKRESLKRLTIRAFVHDSQVSMAYFQAPTISYAELNMAVPYPPSVWFAENSKEWRQELLWCTSGSRRLLLTEVLADVTVLNTCPGQTDLQLCCFAAIHALGNQVWDLQQQFTLLFSAPEAKRRRMDSWCMSRQRDLYQDLIAIRMYCERHVAHHEIRLLLEYVMMALHALMAHIQRFAGKEGENEARRVAPIVSEWRLSPASRLAIWHAGQVLRTARQFPPTTLKNFYAVATYHAALVLWTYSILGNRSSEEGEAVVSGDSGSHENSSMALVMLDGEENDDARAFCTLGHGIPGLSHPGVTGTFCTLEDPALTMRLSADTLRSNLLSTDQAPPLLVCNLIGLMEDLGTSLGCFSAAGSPRADIPRSTG
ncbi:hypothetical protein FCIRC_6724 [Fusarium circinatum]|uniref:Transcription factor domain-containing protein n=1 Tax=Fusarium circinatum TaxID=48490 RepID=A0A8H5U053_FUSCI|nr:hypothetical protein FCIRC_6724 [Fusarium circinatum]